MITEAVFLAAVGAAISLLFSYVPRLRVWYAEHDEDFKKLFMLGVNAAVAAIIVVLSCLPIGGAPLFAWVDCSRQGLLDFAVMVVSIIIGNQAIFSISPKLKDVQAANMRFQRDRFDQEFGLDE